jgi:hypothetical protein
MAAVHLAGSAHPDPVTGRTWVLEVVVCPDGSLAVLGLPGTAKPACRCSTGSPATVCELVELVAQDEDTERAPPR